MESNEQHLFFRFGEWPKDEQSNIYANHSETVIGREKVCPSLKHIKTETETICQFHPHRLTSRGGMIIPCGCTIVGMTSLSSSLQAMSWVSVLTTNLF